MSENHAMIDFREAADRVWEMAREYERKGMWELADTFKSIATELHDLAREKEKANMGNISR